MAAHDTPRIFNPWIHVAPRVEYQTASWWVEHPHSTVDWYARAKSEAPRMSASPEARLVLPRCLDDIK